MIYDFLIIGAGLSGLKAAGELHAAGRRVLVLDKGRGVGGRAATRRWDGVPVDHGAQFFTARTPEFRAQVADWLARDVCFPWCNGFSQWDDDARGVRAPEPAEAVHPRYACRAGMSALGKDLARALPEGTLRMQSRAVRLTRVADHWQVELDTTGDGGETLAAHGVILSLPTPQALTLLKDFGLLERVEPSIRQSLEAVEYAPTLALMLRGPAEAPAWQGIQLRDETLSWISDDTSKRPKDSPDAARVFVLHASGGFSQAWQGGDLDEAARRMIARAGEIVGGWITQLPDRQMHRWRYAHVPRGVADAACLQVGGLPLYLCGDAFLGAKIEGAYGSGMQAARNIVSAAG